MDKKLEIAKMKFEQNIQNISNIEPQDTTNNQLDQPIVGDSSRYEFSNNPEQDFIDEFDEMANPTPID